MIDAQLEKQLQGFSALQSLFDTDFDVRRLFTAEDALEAGEYGRLTVEALQKDPAANQLFAERWTLPELNLSTFLQLPEGSFGRVYADMLVANGFDPDYVIQIAPVEGDDDLSYFKRLWRTTHDFHHIATGIGTDPRGEVALQAFLMGQLPIPFSVVVVSMGLLRTSVVQPDRIPALIDAISDAFRRGRHSPQLLLAQRWDRFWALPVAEVRQQLQIAD
ncbi:Coq4 family protein [Synechococcus elongatus IITB4]|uniref:Coq4 family protein n=1 Tax=Synechococcus elongatus TaxID=32046 RepID=UPI0030D1CA1C